MQRQHKLINCINLLPISLNLTKYPIYHGKTLGCRLSYGFMVYFICVNFLTMIFIAATRYIAVTYPHRFKIWLTNRKCSIVILCIWTFSVLLCVIIAEFMVTLDLIPCYGVCMLTYTPTGVPGHDAVYVIVLVILFIFPIGFMTFFYWKVFITVHKSSQSIRQVLLLGMRNISNHSSRKTKKREYQLTVTFYIMFITYLISYLPYFLVHFMRILCITPSNFSWTFVTTASTIINSVINPYVFLFRSGACKNFWSKPVRRGRSTRIIHVRSNTTLLMTMASQNVN
ncbi:Trace amine-associated receptor 7e [Trichoplax sp. H2]|nr:Trace amine-associated receptor 7e [Trichoplax sp. H2]|eukprot:RDD41287.1 Trace amine-associated receptor 7e [Trichoplax sp. H2]